MRLYERAQEQHTANDVAGFAIYSTNYHEYQQYLKCAIEEEQCKAGLCYCNSNIPNDPMLLLQLYATGELEAECDDEAFYYCRLVGEKGGAKVLYFLGVCYHFGWGTIKDLKAAIKYYVRAAGLGSFEALKRLYDLQSNYSVKISLQNAFRGFCEKADYGDAKSQFNAGYCHFEGIGTSDDKAKARDLFLKSADQGYTDAMYMLVYCQEKGLGDGYNGMQGIGLLEFAAEIGSTEAQYQLGDAYYWGKIICSLKIYQDYKQAVEWFYKAADQNHTWATYFLAGCYCSGYGVQKDAYKAFYLHKKAALMGNEHAQNAISNFFSHKEFELAEDEWPVGIDYYKAAHWNWKAVDQRYFYAYYMPDILKAIGLAQKQRDELMKQTSSFESAKIWYDIAKYYETGDRVEKDKKKAFYMYKLAARLGFESIPASIALGRCYSRGIGTGVDTQQAIHWYEKAAMYGHEEAAKSLLSLIYPESTNNGLKTESPFVTLAECYENGREVTRNEDTVLLMREHAAAEGDIKQAKLVIEAYISGNGNEHRFNDVVLMVARTHGLLYQLYQQFVDKLRYSIGELDKFRILQNAAAAVRAEIMGINLFIE